MLSRSLTFKESFLKVARTVKKVLPLSGACNSVPGSGDKSFTLKVTVLAAPNVTSLSFKPAALNRAIWRISFEPFTVLFASSVVVILN